MIIYLVDKLQRPHNGFYKLILRANAGTLVSKLGLTIGFVRC